MDVSQVRVKEVDNIEIPEFCRVKQNIPDNSLENVGQKTTAQLEQKNLKQHLQSGDQVAVAVGSRGIDRLSEVVTAVVQYIKDAGAVPCIVPAMGSHGGATAAGQKEILEDYGVKEDKVGAPIKSSMDVVKVGETSSGVPVYIDKIAYNSDAVIVINRIKVHTDFSGVHESGIFKMMTIGLGKHQGAAALHRQGFEVFHNLIPEAARVVLSRAPILMGVGLLENGHDNICDIRAWFSGEIEAGEKKILEKQKDLMPQIPFDQIDILIVEEMGKDISGSGMDTNVIGRIKPVRPDIDIILTLDLTPSTHGNATGMGLADLTTQTFFDKFDPVSTYTNHLTAQSLQTGKMPIVLKDDLFALKCAVKIANKSKDNLKIVRIKNTLEIMKFDISRGLMPEVEDQEHTAIVSQPYELAFTSDNKLKRLDLNSF